MDQGYTLDELVGEYEEIKELIDDFPNGALEFHGKTGCTDLESILPDCKVGVQKALEVYLIDLRRQIRERLDDDENSQLAVTQVETEQIEEPDHAIPKNDYRRQQNSAKG